jgi:hypothetical protein
MADKLRVNRAARLEAELVVERWNLRSATSGRERANASLNEYAQTDVRGARRLETCMT